MIDQAENLRKLMGQIKKQKDINPVGESKTKVISISSGKGGVGKTNFSVNFAISLRRLGHSVAIIDADIGLSNIDILLGLNITNTISDIIFNDKDIFDVMVTGPEDIKIISGGSGLKELSLLNNDNFPKLIKEIEKIQNSFDFIIIDTGAGISSAVTDFIMVSNEVIVICTPDPTSIMDSYTLIKSIIQTDYKGKINIVCNQVINRSEGKAIFDKLYNAINNFLSVQVEYLGYIEKNELINQAVRNQVPFTISHPNSPLSKRISLMTMSYLNDVSSKNQENKVSFAKKIVDIFLKRSD